MMSSAWQRRQFPLLMLFFQICFIIIFAFFAEFHDHALPDPRLKIYVNTDYPLFQDVHVMAVLGLGFLMAFLKRYGFAAVSLNLFMCAFVAQWAIIVRGFFNADKAGIFDISIAEMMTADISCVPVLISMGALLGRLTPTQMTIMALIQTAIGTFVEYVFFNIMHCNDGGRALLTHAFGAYFGLACSLFTRPIHVITRNGETRTIGENEDVEESDIQHSELFSMIGSLFLWIFFPSFNAAARQPEDARHRAIMNTYLALTSCTVVTFLMSSLSDKEGRFNMMHIQSSPLAGGVAIGAVANAILYPWHSLAIGFIAGVVSVFGHTMLQPFLRRFFKVADTCGVNNLHGLPGLISGISSIVIAVAYEPKEYGSSLYTIYPYFRGGPKRGDRDLFAQAMFQLYGTGFVFGSAVIGGAITGLILRIPILHQLTDEYADKVEREGFFFGHPDAEAEWRKKWAERELQLALRDPHNSVIF